MQKENINLTINGEVKNPIEIILRDGQAGPIVEPLKYSLDGVIFAPREFSKQIANKSAAVVEYSFWERYIKIKENPNSKYAGVVRGEVQLNPDLIAFAINKDKYLDSKELINHVRKYAHCFKTLNEAKELIQSLQNFEIKFEQTHIKNDDRKGNSEEHVKNAIKYHKGEVKTQLLLSMPIFIGADSQDINVEIEIDRKGTTPVFGFYSLELEVLIRKQTEQLISEEIALLSKEFICLRVS